MLGSYRNSNGYTDKEHVNTEPNRLRIPVPGELVINSPCESAPQRKGESKASKCNGCSHAPVANQEADIGLQPDKEQVQDESKVGNECEVGDGFCREDCRPESRHSAHHRRAKQNTPHNFGNDLWLADLGERPVKEMADDDDQSRLQGWSA